MEGRMPSPLGLRPCASCGVHRHDRVIMQFTVILSSSITKCTRAYYGHCLAILCLPLLPLLPWSAMEARMISPLGLRPCASCVGLCHDMLMIHFADLAIRAHDHVLSLPMHLLQRVICTACRLRSCVQRIVPRLHLRPATPDTAPSATHRLHPVKRIVCSDVMVTMTHLAAQ